MIPVNIFLILFLFFALLVLVFTFFNVYHLVRFGEARMKTVVITIVYVLGVLIMFSWATINIANADWSASIDLFPTDIIVQ